MSVRQHGRFGRRPGVSEIGSQFKLESYLVDPLPVWNGDDDFTSGVKDWGLFGNGPDPLVTDQGPDFQGVGDCVWASAVHKCMADAWTSKEQPVGNWNDWSVWPTPNWLVPEYLQVEGGDNGTDLGAFLLWWTQNELGPIGKLGGFVQLVASPGGNAPATGALYQSAFHIGGGLFAGFLVSYEAVDQYDAGHGWTSLSTNWAGGHGCPHLRRNAKKGGLITWATDQDFSWEWKRLCTEEEYMLLTPEMMAAPGGVFHGIQVAQLKADIKALGGTVS